ncbi:MAG: AI-2E family transporter [Acutalibacteraceae bacterium]|nr:AI-2E family transporter [Acutalibacteraceae bacterium]
MENNKKTVAENTSAESKPTSEELIANVIPEDGGIEIKDDKKEKKRSDGGKIIIEFNKKTVKYFILAALTVILFAWGINNTDKVSTVYDGVSAILSPFLLGSCFAFITNVLLRPLENLYEKIFKKSKKKIFGKVKRPVCLIFSTLIIVGMLFALLFMIIPEFIDALKSLVASAPEYLKQAETWISALMKFASEHGITLPEFSFNSEKIISTVTNFINDNGLVDKTLTFTGSVVSGIVNLVVAVAFSLYLLAQKEKLGSQAKSLMQAFLPKKSNVDRVVSFVQIVDRTFTNFITGQITEAVIIGSLCFIGMLIFRMPYAAVVSVLVGVTALIPVFGAFIGTAVGAFLILFDDPIKALWFIVFIVVLQQLEGNLIYPKVVGKSVGLPGIWVLVAVTIGGTVGGVAGIIISVPACAVIYCLLSQLVTVRLKKKEELETKDKK